MELLTLDIPYPLSINHYWKQSGSKRYLSPEALTYRKEIWAAFRASKHPGFPSDSRLRLMLWLVPPDRRKRDIDNVLKCLLDALQHACVYDDDNQIDELHVIKLPKLEIMTTVMIECL